jgi:hypothetical protein
MAVTSPTGSWYRHYEGTIGGKPVTADIYYIDSNINGSCTYDKEDIILDLFSERDSFVNGNWYIYESLANRQSGENDYHSNNHWLISLTGNTISGVWKSRDGKRQYDIKLKESGYNSSYRFGILQHIDSTTVKLKGFQVGATAAHQLSTPGNDKDADAAFLQQAIMASLGCDSADFEHCIRQSDETFFRQYRAEIDSDITEAESDMYHFETAETTHVIYNKNGMVIMRFGSSQYLGGAHGIYGSSYSCIDVSGKKIWHLSDVLKPDVGVLSTLLEAEARIQFSIPATEALSERLLTDTIKATNNFYFTSAGIFFHYNPYEIASFADGEVELYIPYSKLSTMLLPAFKNRMNIP